MKNLTIITAALFASTAAIAGEPVYVAPAETVIAPVAAVVTPISDWSGMYAGVHVGYGNGRLEEVGSSVRATGVLYGGHVGYNYDFGTVVVGGEIDYSVGDLEFETAPGAAFTDLAHLKARVGYDMGSMLVYGVVGLAYTKLEIGLATYDDTGYAVGLGADYKIASNWTAGAEYLYSHFENFDDENVNVGIHSLQARISYNF